MDNKSEWFALERRVVEWAREHRESDLHYSSRHTWWRAAHADGVCTDDEYALAERVYDNLWDYTGD